MLQIINTQLRIGITTLHNSFFKNVGRLYTTKYKRETTIYALSSGHGKCGVAVIRISGPNALDSLIKMTKISKLEPRKVFLRKIFDPITDDVIDKGLCLWFPNPHSFTGEDCVEFQVHGGPAIISALMSALSKLNFQPALPGEFTRRAFYNNKLDLVEIEGLADLIHAETEQQRKQALLQASGQLSKLYNGWREKLARIVADLEAYIDFNENDNIEDNVLQNCNNSITELLEIIKNHLFDNRRGEILRNGVRIAIIGEPNVGKSTLLNHLVQRNAAIVSPIAGTTRDIIELNTNISGYPVIVADTAGFTKHAKDEIEVEGIRRAKIYTETANLIVLMIDAFKYVNSGKTYKDYIKEYISNMELPDIEISDREKRQTVVIFNKTDLLTEENKHNLKNENAIMMSCTAEEGFQDLINQMTIHLRNLCGDAFNETPVISQIRYRTHLSNCVNYLHNYIETSAIEQYDMVIAVEEIRMAMKELGKITGHVSNEEILDIIFKNFCIGK